MRDGAHLISICDRRICTIIGCMSCKNIGVTSDGKDKKSNIVPC